MFKRLTAILSSIAVSAVTAASVVSCTAPGFADGEKGQRIVVVTDGGHINDKAFNEDAYEGVQTFNKDVFNHGSEHSYVVPADSNYANLISGYKLAVLKKADTLVLPGYTHASVVPGSESFLKDKNIILVDCAYQADNVISLQFNSQLAGFLAGYNTSIWATTPVKDKDGKVKEDDNGKPVLQGDKNGDGHIAIGTFMGGASSKYSTDNYAWGLLLGMAVYNIEAQKNGRALVYSANTPSESSAPENEQVKDIHAMSVNDPNWYSGSFAPTGAAQSGILAKLIDKKKADIMFPIAGGQVTDVIGYETKTYMIGVDVDQAYAYPEAKGRFITSAVKNIHQAVNDALYRASGAPTADGKPGRANTLDIPDNKYKDEHWLGTTPNQFMSWSINYTANTPGVKGDYLLKDNYFNFTVDHKVTNDAPAPEDSLPGMINKEYNVTLNSENPKYYMDGNIIVKFAQDLVNKYGSEFSTFDQNGGQNM